MGRSRSDDRRKEWLRRNKSPDSSASKRGDWMEAKRENEKVHVHFLCTCLSCAQEFSICGLPCFVICPNCHLALKLQFS